MGSCVSMRHETAYSIGAHNAERSPRMYQGGESVPPDSSYMQEKLPCQDV
jgi:hypothetical protein